MSKRKSGSKARSAAYKVIIFCLIGIILVSGYKIATTLLKYRKARSEYTHISEIALVDPTRFTGEIDWDALHEINPEVNAWIYLRNSIINYPVAKGTDNDVYLHHLIDGSYNFAGTIFVDYLAADDFRGYNTVVYGHHMKDGSMFAPLAKIVNDSDYSSSHRQFELVTPTEKYHIQVFAGFVTDASSDIYNMYFPDEASYQAHLDMLMAYNQIDSGDVSVTSADRIVTLSTCVDAEGEARYVVTGKLVPWTDAEKAEALEIESKK